MKPPRQNIYRGPRQPTPETEPPKTDRRKPTDPDEAVLEHFLPSKIEARIREVLDGRRK